MGKRSQIHSNLDIPSEHRFDPSNIMGSRALFNLCTGARGFGKTYAAKKIAIKRYLNDESTWVYSRYYKDNIKDQLKKGPFFGDIMANGAFPGYVFRNDNENMYIAPKPKDISKKPKWKVFGHFAGLTGIEGFRGTTPITTNLWVLDEFIKKSQGTRYPTGTIGLFYDIYNSIDRNRNATRALLLANAADIVNPFFREWHITPIPLGTHKYFKVGTREVFYENAYNAEFAEDVKNSYLAGITDGTSYGRYAYENEFDQESGMFVAKKPKGARCHYDFVFMGERFGCWFDGFTGDVYVSRRVGKNAVRCALTRSDMTPNYVLIDRNYPYLKYCLKCYSYGQLFFESDQIRESFLDMLRMCGLK